MADTAELPTKKMKQIYVRPGTHKKVRILAGLEERAQKFVVSDILDPILDARIAARMIGASKADFKRQARGKRK